MSIPLDRLYHYLENLSNNNIVIYRWSPHGSRKLEDLTSLRPLSNNRLETFTCLNMICHDQEPLNYNYYLHDECVVRMQKVAKERKTLPLPKSYWADSDEFIHRYAKTHLRVMVGNMFNLYDTVLLCHSEKNSIELAKYEQNNFIGVYYWSHALIARDWFRYAEYDPQLKPNFDAVTSDFLIYNRAWNGTREYRLKFAELLVDHQLVEHCNIRFNPVDDKLYTQHEFKNPALTIRREDLETIIPHNDHHSSASADYNGTDYQTSGIEVVLETLFDDNRLHLTEKALRPIACGRPFMLAASPGSLKYLQSYGFKTFHGFIDETYDCIADPVLRLQAMVEEMDRISKLSTEEKRTLWENLYEIANYNKRHFFSNALHQQIVNEFNCNLSNGIKQSQQHLTGKWWYESVKIERTDINPTDMTRAIDQWFANRTS